MFYSYQITNRIFDIHYSNIILLFYNNYIFLLGSLTNISLTRFVKVYIKCQLMYTLRSLILNARQISKIVKNELYSFFTSVHVFSTTNGITTQREDKEAVNNKLYLSLNESEKS